MTSQKDTQPEPLPPEPLPPEPLPPEPLPPEPLPHSGGSWVRGKDGRLTLAHRTRSKRDAADETAVQPAARQEKAGADTALPADKQKTKRSS